MALFELKIDRLFKAPCLLVWKVWTDPDLLGRWYGPNLETKVHEFDLQPEGRWLHEMKMEKGSSFQKMVFKKIDPLKQLVWHHFSSVDSDWNPAPNAMMPQWPENLLTTVTFSDMGKDTHVVFSQVPVDASDAQMECFSGMAERMKGGWGQGYKMIDELLIQLSAAA